MKVTVYKGQNLAQALEKMNMTLEMPCNGAGSCGGCLVEVERFGKVKACQFRLAGTYEVAVPQRMVFQTLGLSEKAQAFVQEKLAEKETKPVIAIDLGTTTVALAGCYNKQVVSKSFINPQRSYGADVISRIDACCKGKQEELTSQIRQSLIEAITSIWEELHIVDEMIMASSIIVVAGNTTMLQLLFGFDCCGLSKAPFTPSNVKLYRDILGKEKEGFVPVTITGLPGISAFVGADIVSGIYAVDLLSHKEATLFCDLGTNGELALWANDKLYVTATAAGPAFEGNEIATHLYGAGVVKTLAKMRKEQIIDETGLLSEAYFETGYPISTVSGQTIYFTQDIIRMIQLAKGAIRAGIAALLKCADISYEAIEKVYVAGGMGYFMNPEDAMQIGLFPSEFEGKIEAVGNTSLYGAMKYIYQADADAKILDYIRENATVLMLAEDDNFKESYVTFINF